MEEYYQDFETAMIRLNIVEDPEATMARFMGGLRKDFVHIVEMTEYGKWMENVESSISKGETSRGKKPRYQAEDDDDESDEVSNSKGSASNLDSSLSSI